MLVRKESREFDPPSNPYPDVFNVLMNTSLSDKDLWALWRVLWDLKEYLEKLNSGNKKDMFNALSKILVQHKEMDHLLKVFKRKFPFEAMWF